MAQTIEERKKKIYSSMSKEELVEEMLKRDGFDERQSFQAIAKEKIPEKAVKAIQDGIVKRVEDGSIVDRLLVVEQYGQFRPTQFLTQMFEKSVDQQFVEDFKAGIGKYLKEHYKEICENVMYRAFLNGITKDNPLLYEAINQVISERDDSY
jgi:hypothetical protein